MDGGGAKMDELSYVCPEDSLYEALYRILCVWTCVCVLCWGYTRVGETKG